MDENERRVGDVARIRGREETPGLCPVNACPSIIACTPHLALLLCFVFLLCHYFVLFLSRIIVVFVTIFGCFGVFYVWKFFSEKIERDLLNKLWPQSVQETSPQGDIDLVPPLS